MVLTARFGAEAAVKSVIVYTRVVGNAVQNVLETQRSSSSKAVPTRPVARYSPSW